MAGRRRAEGGGVCGEDIDEEHRPELLEAMAPLDLTYRGKLGETLDSGAAASPGKADSGFDVTLDSDADGPKLLASPASAPVKAIELLGESPVWGNCYRFKVAVNCVFNRKGW